MMRTNTMTFFAALALSLLGAAAAGCTNTVETGGGGGDSSGMDDGTGDDSGGGGGDDGGDGGGGGEAAAFCAEECSSASDCLADPEHDCEDGRCVTVDAPDSACTDDAECRALFSGWVTECTDDAGCQGQVCIDTGGGEGRCATEPSEFLTCDQLMLVEVTMSRVDGSGDVTVCGNETAECDGDLGACIDPCTDNADCTDPNHPTCNPDTGRCECTADSCTDFGDACTDSGFCGCSSSDACPDETTHPGTSWVCE